MKVDAEDVPELWLWTYQELKLSNHWGPLQTSDQFLLETVVKECHSMAPYDSL
ncbi:hypothetical protein AM1_3295 [Acaryochloris marina MBIC11017]|uniref:Uncharacterized protein n=1 Tax=Acaryochloris marina (strain MBIC 11017) TaxID=329726 RepID=B0BYY9_ACAM1|nr:hypothetical protein AM1_3295 [Acaryochloris marina MBIC11017]